MSFRPIPIALLACVTLLCAVQPAFAQLTVTINQAAGQADPTNASPINFTAVFSESVSDFATGDVIVTGSAFSGMGTGTVTGSGTTYNVAVTGMIVTGSVTVTIPADKAHGASGGNQPSTSTDNLVIHDISPPNVTVNQFAGQADPTKNSPVRFTVLFTNDEPVGFTNADIVLGGTAGATTVTLSGSGVYYTASVTGMTQPGTVTASIPAGVLQDAAGNWNNASTSTDNEVTFDNAGPKPTINQAAGQDDPTDTPPVNFTVVFDESVSNFATGDVTLSGSAGATTATVTGSGTTYNVAVSGMTGPGTVIASVPAGAASDALGNLSSASTSTDNSVTYNPDATPPDVTINQAAGQSDPTNGTTINFTVVFTEPVADFATGDVTLGGTAGATAATVTGSGTTYNVAATGMAVPGTVTVSITSGVAHDGAGNPNNASTSTDNTVTYDNVAPAANVAGPSGTATKSGPVTYTVTWTESVTGLTASDIALSKTGSANAVAQVTGSGQGPYTITLSACTGDGAIGFSIPAGSCTDAAGNPSTAHGPSAAFTVDNTGPAVTINQAGTQADPTDSSPVNFAVTFSEPVTDFATGDVTLSGTAGATTATVSGFATTYNVAVTGMSQSGTVIAAIAAGEAHDDLGNGSSASTSSDDTVTYDNAGPSVTINQSAGQVDPTGGSPVSFTVVFSEPVSDFGMGDVTLSGTAGATDANVMGGGTTYTVLVSGMTQSGSVTASVAAGVAHDAAGNGNAASTSADDTVTYALSLDTTSPTVTIDQSTGQVDPTNASAVGFTVVFSEPVSDFATGDVTLSGTAGANTALVTGSGTTYAVAVSGMTQSGTVIASVAAGAAHDSAGNAGAASSSTDNTVTFDMTAPAVQITSPTTDSQTARNCNSLDIAGTASDTSGIASVAYSINGGTALACSGTSAWSASGLALDWGANTIAVSAVDGAGNASTDTLEVECTDSNPGAWWQGTAMVSLPIVPDSTDPKPIVGFDGSYWYLFDPTGAAYVGYPDARTMLDPAATTPGRGFWAHFAAGVSPHPCGTIPSQTQPVSIHLLPGWNLFGQPFISPVKWDLGAIQVKSGALTKALRDSWDAVSSYAWGWNTSASAYYLIYDPSLAPTAHGYLDPWQAFWIRAIKECDLILPPP